jgi:hypothetical protein
MQYGFFVRGQYRQGRRHGRPLQGAGRAGVPGVPVAGNAVSSEPNTYEDSLCQETNYSLERFFVIFSAFQVLA